eukprot:CAMPEP_0117035394 /NCGR_PEP_ID=MMETSP0472-20121206/25136_1 /TAXON_ID=693140 ORGANISM="Tiarina fusus, Strain LIS" /NCGR_SAMPLE_ID=MMETSP0472 /ASSEMBLY_ACC=CAM_ASM_000603 /LENGTH=195 /DNA_ID=CAMNT_0004744843 /DNA_START=129 /DNA_END=716 /DNA_ORIENTATION=-
MKDKSRVQKDSKPQSTYSSGQPGYTVSNSAGVQQNSNAYPQTPGEIKFYHKQDAFYEFTNFYEPSNGILIDGYNWKTSEAYYQASKFQDPVHVQRVNDLLTPREAFNYARQYKSDIRSDWFQINMQVMRKALLAKFSQHPDLLQMLLKTKDKLLIEHTANDNFWGDGGNGSGRNNLGKLLMKVREEMSGCLLPKF